MDFLNGCPTVNSSTIKRKKSLPENKISSNYEKFISIKSNKGCSSEMPSTTSNSTVLNIFPIKNKNAIFTSSDDIPVKVFSNKNSKKLLPAINYKENFDENKVGKNSSTIFSNNNLNLFDSNKKFLRKIIIDNEKCSLNGSINNEENIEINISNKSSKLESTLPKLKDKKKYIIEKDKMINKGNSIERSNRQIVDKKIENYEFNMGKSYKEISIEIPSNEKDDFVNNITVKNMTLENSTVNDIVDLKNNKNKISASQIVINEANKNETLNGQNEDFAYNFNFNSTCSDNGFQPIKDSINIFNTENNNLKKRNEKRFQTSTGLIKDLTPLPISKKSIQRSLSVNQTDKDSIKSINNIKIKQFQNKNFMRQLTRISELSHKISNQNNTSFDSETKRNFHKLNLKFPLQDRIDDYQEQEFEFEKNKLEIEEINEMMAENIKEEYEENEDIDKNIINEINNNKSFLSYNHKTLSDENSDYENSKDVIDDDSSVAKTICTNSTQKKLSISNDWFKNVLQIRSSFNSRRDSSPITNSRYNSKEISSCIDIENKLLVLEVSSNNIKFNLLERCLKQIVSFIEKDLKQKYGKFRLKKIYKKFSLNFKITKPIEKIFSEDKILSTKIFHIPTRINKINLNKPLSKHLNNEYNKIDFLKNNFALNYLSIENTNHTDKVTLIKNFTRQKSNEKTNINDLNSPSILNKSVKKNSYSYTNFLMRLNHNDNTFNVPYFLSEKNLNFYNKFLQLDLSYNGECVEVSDLPWSSTLILNKIPCNEKNLKRRNSIKSKKSHQTSNSNFNSSASDDLSKDEKEVLKDIKGRRFDEFPKLRLYQSQITFPVQYSVLKNTNIFNNEKRKINLKKNRYVNS